MKINFRSVFSGALLLVIIVSFFNCKKENTIIVKPTPTPVIIKDTSIVNRFIFNGLKDYYLWKDQIPNLVAAKYGNKDSLNILLNGYNDPQKFFTGLLYQYNTVDKWSFLVNDSAKISNWIQGISETMGYDFMLQRIGTAGDIFGFVRYVYKNSPAEKAGIKRGDLFMKVNDTQLTVTNYQSLLFATKTYKLSLASITSNTIKLNGNSVTMTAVTMQENPILLDTTFMVDNYKVGYLVYNGFNADFDLQLNDVFKKFKDASIDKLILDLRYNGGGSVQTAKYLASMIYGTATTSVFFKSAYNKGLQDYIVSVDGPSSLSENFTDKILATPTTAQTAINSRNLTSLYVITSDNTASASELLINGLLPYMQVFSVGINTAGKYVASWTIKDWDANGVVNPKNPYAMQPIVVKIANSNGVSDYVSGLAPSFSMEEDIANLMPLGDPNETLLKPILNKIKGLPLTAIALRSKQLGLHKVADSKSQRPFAHDMYINKPEKIHLNFK